MLMECVITEHSASHVLLDTPFHWQFFSSPDKTILFCHAIALGFAFGLYMHVTRCDITGWLQDWYSEIISC